MWGELNRSVYSQHSRPVEKCIARRMEQRSSEEDQCIGELHAEENEGGNNGEREAQQILIHTADFHFQGSFQTCFNYWRHFENFITKTRLFKYIENVTSTNWKFSDKKL